MVATKTKNKTIDIYYYKSPVDFVVDKICPFDFRITRFENEFNPAFTYYFTQYKKDGSGARATLNRREYTASDTNLSSRVLNNWATEGVLPEGVIGENNSTWKKFNLVELAWLKAVEKMREFGLPLETIKQVRYWVMQWDSKNQDYPWFEHYMARAYHTEEDIYIAILSNGLAELANTYDLERYKITNDGESNHFLLISMREIIKSLRIDPAKKLSTLLPVRDAERKLLKAIRLENNKKINIRVHDGFITEIGTAKVYVGDEKINTFEQELKNEGAYAEVLSKYESGKRQSTEVYVKKRYKK